jgi:hypothetical protein
LSTNELKTKFLTSFWSFRTQRGDFNASNISWASKNSPITFWESYLGDHTELASFAIRLFQLIYNAVPSERAFSCMNLIQTPIRGNLDAEKSTKIAYIYMNHRQIDKLGSKLSYTSMVDMPVEEQVEYEELAVQEDDQGDDDDIEESRELVDDEDSDA